MVAQPGLEPGFSAYEAGVLPLHHRAVLAPDPKTGCAKEDEQARTYGNPGGATRRTRTDTRSVEGCWATITQVLHNDSAPEGLRVHPTVLLTKIAAGSYPDHSNVSIANRVSLAERRGLEPLRRCRRSRISNPAPYLLGQRSVYMLANAFTSIAQCHASFLGTINWRRL